MRPVVIGDDIWVILLLSPTDPALIDRTGTLRVATTDPANKTINISRSVVPPLLDRVILHEVAHAITISHGLLYPLRGSIPVEAWIPAEEWSAEVMEKYGIEAIVAASESLGRPLCIRGYCASMN